MTRKHFRALAVALKTTHASEATISAVADACSEANPYFRRDLFLAAATYRAPTHYCAECGEYFPCSDSQRDDIRFELRERHQSGKPIGA